MESHGKRLFGVARPLGKGPARAIRPSLTALSDETLAAKAAAGSGDHFEELVRRYADSVYRTAYRLCGNPAEAEDIVQESFIKIFRALPKVRLDLPLKPWLYKIAVNTALSSLRRKAGRPAIGLAAAEETPAPGDDSERAAERMDAQAALATLPPAYRTIVVLRAVEQLSFSEISDILSIPEATARTRFSRAKSMLQHLLGT